MLTGLDLKTKLRSRYNEDGWFKKILDTPKEYKNFVVEDELMYLQNRDGRVLCIPAVQIDERSAREIVIDEAHSLLAHLGARKTLAYLRDVVWWK
ncbi:hypothetical protein BDN72DRAFT_771581, partial [Pluteus cervinus]